MPSPLLLDLFCGAGGAAMGYARAGFRVVGVDILPHPDYPFPQITADAMTFPIRGVDAVHASPPCQAFSTITPDPEMWPNLVGPLREKLQASGLPWVIENVPGAPLRNPVTLCGSMFGLRIRRHRLFESNVALISPRCDHKSQGPVLGVYGLGGGGYYPSPNRGGGNKAPQHMWGELMGMPWARPTDIRKAIPPVYTEMIGAQLIQAC